MTTDARRARGFTLIEMLVAVSIAALIIALLLPALDKGREAARLAQCAQHNATIGSMLTMWALDHDHVLPESNERLSPGRGIDSTFKPLTDEPTGLAKLIRAGYYEDPRALYCPSWSHPSAQYDNVGEDPGAPRWNLNPYGGWPADDNAAALRVVMISYHYRAGFKDPITGRPDSPAFLSDPTIDSETPLNADHWTRREELFGVAYGHVDRYNTLYADMAVKTLYITEDQFDERMGMNLSNASWDLQQKGWETMFVE